MNRLEQLWRRFGVILIIPELIARPLLGAVGANLATVFQLLLRIAWFQWGRRATFAPCGSSINGKPALFHLKTMLRIFVFILTCEFTLASDWPRFLGPQGTLTSAETNLLEFWGTNGPPVIWERSIGAGYGAPSVKGNQIVFHHRVKNEEVVECAEAATGKSLWRYAYPSAFIDPYGYNNGPRATPLLTTDRCFTFGAEGKLLCLNLMTSARTIWQRMPERTEVPQHFLV